jgi:hypothetical protein
VTCSVLLSTVPLFSQSPKRMGRRFTKASWTCMIRIRANSFSAGSSSQYAPTHDKAPPIFGAVSSSSRGAWPRVLHGAYGLSTIDGVPTMADLAARTGMLAPFKKYKKRLKPQKVSPTVFDRKRNTYVAQPCSWRGLGRHYGVVIIRPTNSQKSMSPESARSSYIFLII